jgi:hypothetical protein
MTASLTRMPKRIVEELYYPFVTCVPVGLTQAQDA